MTSRPKRILFLVPSLAIGGAERVLCTILRHLDRKRFEPTLAVCSLHQASLLSEIPPQVRIIDLNVSRVRYAVPKIAALVWRLRPHVVFSTLGHLNLTIALLKPFLPRELRLIARETSIPSETLRPGSPFAKFRVWGYRHLYGRFSTVICQSEAMRDDLAKNFGVPEAKCEIVYNPLDLERARVLARAELPIPRSGEAPLLVAAGRLRPEKGFDLLLRALALVPRARLILLGAGSEAENLKRLSSALSLEDRVSFVGEVMNPFPYYAAADIFVLSSRYEGFPNVVLEALAVGTPVVATPAIGGVREILESVPGCFLAEEISPESLGRAIQAGLAVRLRIASKYMLRYDAQAIVSKYEEILSKNESV